MSLACKQVRSAAFVEQVAACMLQLEAHLRRGSLCQDWDPLARLAARKATAASRTASEALPPGPIVDPEPAASLDPQPSTPQAGNTTPRTLETLPATTGKGIFPSSSSMIVPCMCA